MAGTNGITINAGPNDVIVLRGLDIDGGPNGSNSLNGVRFLAGGALMVQNSTIRNFTGRTVNGLEFHAAGLDLKGQVIRERNFVAETEIYDQKGDLIATGAGTFRYLKGERSDGVWRRASTSSPIRSRRAAACSCPKDRRSR